MRRAWWIVPFCLLLSACAATRDETISFDDFIVSVTPIGRHDR
jgi:hypothetical protein